jgi:hypothetical protein
MIAEWTLRCRVVWEVAEKIVAGEACFGFALAEIGGVTVDD